MSLFTWDHQDGIAKIHLDHPKHNTLTYELLSGLTSVINNMSSAPRGVRPRVIVISSAVEAQFSQGIDPLAIVNGSMEDRKKIFLALGDLVEAVWYSYIPVITDVSGPAIAGGAVLAMLGDFILMDVDRSKICFSEVKVGLPVPAFIQRLVQVKTSPSNWTEMILLGRNYNATDAMKIGIANALYRDGAEREDLLSQYIGKIVRLSPEVLSESLRQTRLGERWLLDAFRQDMASFSPFLTDEFLGGALKSVLAGEAPKFK
jgi:enoyl-CoA hydratase/carnithine racemase